MSKTFKLNPKFKAFGMLALLSGVSAVAYNALSGDLETEDKEEQKGEVKAETPIAEEEVAKKEEKKSSWMPSFLSKSKKAEKKTLCPLGTCADNPLEMEIVPFHGHIGVIAANGNSLTTTPTSAFGKLGIYVKVHIRESIASGSEIIAGDTTDCYWRTHGFAGFEYPSMAEKEQFVKFIVFMDRTVGGDAIVTLDPTVKTFEDLVDKEIAMLQATPSQTLYEVLKNRSSLSRRGKSSLTPIFVDPEGGVNSVYSMMLSSKNETQTAILWDPELTQAVENGARVVASTKDLPYTIVDGVVCNAKLLDDAKNEEVFTKFVKGLMDTNDQMNANPQLAVDAMLATMPVYATLEESKGEGSVLALAENLVWTGKSDNYKIFGFDKTPIQTQLLEIEREKFGKLKGVGYFRKNMDEYQAIYRETGDIDTKYPVYEADELLDIRFVANVLSQNVAEVKKEVRKSIPTYTAQDKQAAKNQAPTFSNPISIEFASGKATLTEDAKDVIEDKLIPFLESTEGVVLISGHTDSTGSMKINMSLSQQRANAVKTELVKVWGESENRFITIGNGPTQPICNEKDWRVDGYGSLAECYQVNRAVRFGVISRM